MHPDPQSTSHWFEVGRAPMGKAVVTDVFPKLLPHSPFTLEKMLSRSVSSNLRYLTFMNSCHFA